MKKGLEREREKERELDRGDLIRDSSINRYFFPEHVYSGCSPTRSNSPATAASQHRALHRKAPESLKWSSNTYTKLRLTRGIISFGIVKFTVQFCLDGRDEDV